MHLEIEITEAGCILDGMPMTLEAASAWLSLMDEAPAPEVEAGA